MGSNRRQNGVWRLAKFTAGAKRLIFAVAGPGGIAFAAACAYLWTQQRALIFQPQAAVCAIRATLGPSSAN